MTTWDDISRRGENDLKEALVQGFRDFTAGELNPMTFNADDTQRIAALREKYASDAWNLSF
jgi:hypothetical protein